MPSWSWDLVDVHGAALVLPPGAAAVPPSGGFPVQADAETWLGESWRQLLADGVEHVHLRHEGERVYGPLALRPPA